MNKITHVLALASVMIFSMGFVCGLVYEKKQSSITIQYDNKLNGTQWTFILKDKDVTKYKKEIEEEIKKYPNAKIVD